MAKNALTGSPETTNGAKLRRLLVDGGTPALRKNFDRCHPPKNLRKSLKKYRDKIEVDFTQKYLTRKQKEWLFPSDGSDPDSKNFDISLLFYLLSTICDLEAPGGNWNFKPHKNNRTLPAQLVRIKLHRNELCHEPKTAIDEVTFAKLWKDISGILLSLGLEKAAINRLEDEPCGEDYIRILQEWADREGGVLERQKKTHETLEKVRKMQQETRKDVGTLCQTQQTQLKTLQDTNAIVTTVSRTLKEEQEASGHRHEEIMLSISSRKEGQKRGRSNDALQKLVKCDFIGEIKVLLARYQEGTREWVFREVEHWLNDKKSKNRAMVITGNAGMGKSVISAAICNRMQAARALAGYHFCQHNNPRYRCPKLMLQSLAFQLCHVLPMFKEALVEKLTGNIGKDIDAMDVEELFALLLKEPLNTLAEPEGNLLMVIDGLDESEYQHRNELCDVIATHFFKLPRWIRFLVTSRPEETIKKALEPLRPFHLDSNSEQNNNDIKLFFVKRLESIPKAENTEDIVEKLVAKSEGLMLYAHFLLETIEEDPSVLTQGDVNEILPSGISSAYHRYFERLEKELKTEFDITGDSFLNFLSALAASREPLLIDFVPQVLLLSTQSSAASKKVLKVIKSVSSLLPIRENRIHIFHKSVKDWLTDISFYGRHDFSVDEEKGHRKLADLCSTEFDSLLQRRVLEYDFTQMNDTTTYALQHGVQHMLKVDEEAKRVDFEDFVKKYVLSPELVYAKLCVNDIVLTEDVANVQMHENFNSLSRETKASLKSLLSILRKNSWSVMELPHVILQTMVNASRSVLSSEAKKLLIEKYDEISYMELVNMNEQESVVEGQFYCWSTVVCFDISPDQAHMVCECRMKEIQLWSLKNCKMEWRTGPSNEEDFFKLLRMVPVLDPVDPTRTGLSTRSFYRSVAFHPDGKHILPGNLSTVYTIDGEQKELFSKSNCRFSVFTLLGDNVAMLTDCPNNLKRLVIWSLDTGDEISRTTRTEDIVYFQCSPDKNLLAVSHSTGLLCLLDLQNKLTELASISTTTPWGFLTFSVESDALVGMCRVEFDQQHFRCRITTDGFSRKTLSDFSEKEFSGGESGYGSFLDGDATESLKSALSRVIRFGEIGFLLRLKGERALLSSPNLDHVSLINLAKIRKAETKSDTHVEDVAFSTDGENVYVVSQRPPTVTVWEYSTWNQKAKIYPTFPSILPVKDGVFVLNDTVEFWDVELTECKRRWDKLQGIELLPISEEQVACLTKDGTAVVLSTSDVYTSDSPSETIKIAEGWKIIAMNEKFQMITYVCTRNDGIFVDYAVHLSGASFSSPLEIESFSICDEYLPAALYSPKGDFVAVWAFETVNIYKATSGKHHCKLPVSCCVEDVKFITNRTLMVCSNQSIGNFLRMFDVDSGERLASLDIEETPFCLGVHLNSLHVAVGLYGSDVRLIKVHLPGSRLSHE